jgi:hypothetical protein
MMLMLTRMRMRMRMVAEAGLWWLCWRSRSRGNAISGRSCLLSNGFQVVHLL